MAVTPLKVTTRYIRPGVTKVYHLTACEDYTSPTRAELDAGTDLTPEITADGVSGFQTESESVDAPDWDSRFTSKIPGMITAGDSAIKCYASQDTDDVRAVLPRDTAGFVVFMDGGDVPTQMMDVFPAKVGSCTPDRSGSDAVTVEVSFTVTSEPAENVAIPATT